MGPLGIGLVLALVVPQRDTLDTYRGTLTRALVERAMARHRTQDTLVNDYRSRLRFRLSFSFGRRRWARIPAVSVEEQEAVVQWRRPNDLRLDIVGRRARSRSADLSINSMFDRPWFVARGLKDSVRIFGNDFPERAALHPLAADGPAWYSYELNDSVMITSPSAGRLKLYQVNVQPKRNGPSLIAGSMWLDAASAEVVRLTFRYVGTLLWVDLDDEEWRGDSAKARRINSIANRIVSVDADLEYGLQEGKYWMPYRQLIAGRVQVPMITDVVVPFEILTTFHDYEINTGREIVFTVPLPDSVSPDSSREWDHRGHGDDSLAAHATADLWEGGRYEIHRAGSDSLRSYAGWGDSLEIDLSSEDDARIRDVVSDLARLSEELPDELTGRRRYGINYERFADIMRYNRVQGLSLGFGYQLRAPMAFTMFQGTARLGISDGRLTGRLSAIRDAPGGTVTLAGYREIREIEPFNRNFAIGNSINALFTAHDNAEYQLAEGVGLGYEHSLARGLDLALLGRFEKQSSVAGEAESEVNDLFGGSGKFPLNPPVLEGNFFGAAARLEGQRGFSGWSLTADGLAGEGEGVVRLAGEIRQRIGNRRGLSVSIKAGIASDSTLPQALFRAGGLRSVRGFDYGTARGQAFWSVQTDFTLSDSWGFRPVAFLDAGQAARPGHLFDQEPLVGGGIGASLLRGLLRFDLSVPITGEDHPLRFDIVFTAAR
jgi:Haemolysin secretion/activation protein ShlB/FhaC/HecB